MVCEDTNLNFQRTDKLVFIQVFEQGRDAELKKALYAELQRRLERECGGAGDGSDCHLLGEQQGGLEFRHWEGAVFDGRIVILL